MVKQNTGVSKRRTIEFQSTEASFQDNKTYRCRSRANAVGPYVTTEGLTTVWSAGVHHSETTLSLLFYYTSIQNQTNILQNVLVSVYVCVCVRYSTTEPIGLIFCIQKTKFIITKHMNIPVLIRILLCFKIEHIIVTSLHNSLNAPKFLVYYRRKTVYLIKTWWLSLHLNKTLKRALLYP